MSLTMYVLRRKTLSLSRLTQTTTHWEMHQKMARALARRFSRRLTSQHEEVRFDGWQRGLGRVTSYAGTLRRKSCPQSLMG